MLPLGGPAVAPASAGTRGVHVVDSSAFQILVLPTCYGIVLGLLGCLVIRRLIEWLFRLL